MALHTLRTLAYALRVLPLFFLGGCTALELVNSVSQVYWVEVKRDLVLPGPANLKYDLYLPSKAHATLPNTPVVVFFYGGSWNRGHKSEYEFVGRRLAAMGYIVAIPNYRLYPEVRYPEFLEDGALAIAAVQTELSKPNYQALKPARQMVLMGHSAGAYNAAMLAMDERWLKAVNMNKTNTIKGFVGLAGAYNIYPINDPEVAPVFHHPNYPEQSQPINFASKPQAPSLILAPEADTLVSTARNSISLNATLKQYGNHSQLVTVPGTDHITLVGTLSPVLFFKGNSTRPLQRFIDDLYQPQAK